MEMKLFVASWHFDPLIVVLVIGNICLYGMVNGFKQTKPVLCLVPALLLFILAECSPIHALGMRYFSIHMVAHVVELLICGPLLLAGLNPREGAPMHSWIKALSSFFAQQSWVAWLCGVGIMWFWHIPAVFDGAMLAMHQPFSFMPLLHGGSMLLAGMLFSWPIFGPFKSYQLQPLTGIVYLFTACISCSILGLLITFAPLNTWYHSAAMQMPAGDYPNLSPAEDQQAAGLIMWVPCCFVYLTGCLLLLYRWFQETDSVKKTQTFNLNQ